MEQLFDSLSRALATATSRRDALRGIFGVFVGGATMSTLAGCANLTKPSCTSGCIGSDNICYTCSGGASCTTARLNSSCSSPSAGGIYCCSSDNGGGGGGGGSTCPCASGQAYNASYGKCCPGNQPWYDPGGHGYGSGCYASCPYVGDCADRYTLCN